MPVLEIDTSGVKWPETPAVKKAMQAYIHRMAKEEGWRYFATMSFRCLNGVESPDPDPLPPSGWEYLDEIFYDCEPEMVNDISAVYRDVRVVARKDSP